MKMPTEKAGLLFLKKGHAVHHDLHHVVQPDPARLEDYQTHFGAQRGQWPTNSEITSAMLAQYKKPPTP